MPRSPYVTGRSTVIPRRLSLVRQTAEILGREITRGTWIGWLPSERILSQSLEISRPTLREALKVLQREGLIKAAKGRGHRIMYTGGPLGRSVEGTTIHLVCPDQPDQLRDGAGRWMDELRALLFQTDSRLVLHQGPQFRQADPGPVLESLTRQNPDSCWILARTSVQIQRWFEKHKESCLVAGYTHPGIQLPSVFIDLETACRDAVRVLSNSGHNEVGFIQRRPERARDLRSTFGFEAGLKSEPASGRIVHHDGTTASLITATRDLVESDRPATGILVDSAISYATVSTFLMRAGKRIPQDFALISRTHEPFLDALLPSPSCYQYDLQRFGRLVHAGLLDLLAGKEEITRSLVPEYRPGRSV